MKVDYFEKYKPDPFKKNDGGKLSERTIISLFLFVVAVILLLISLFSSWYTNQKFSTRFLKAFQENQQETMRFSTDQFSPAFSYLLHMIYRDPQNEELLHQANRTLLASEYVHQLFLNSREEFSFENFSEDEQRRIESFYDSLMHIDFGRHHHVDKMQECASMRFLSIDGALDFCTEEQERWQKESESLLRALVESLELKDKEKEIFQKLFEGK